MRRGRRSNRIFQRTNLVRAAGGRPARDLWNFARAESGLPLVRLSGGLRPSDTTIYNRFNRWSRRGFWLKLLAALVDPAR